MYTKVSYGVDAPRVIQTLFMGALAAGIAAGGLHQILEGTWGLLALIWMGSVSVMLLLTGLWFLYGTLVAKRRLIAALVDSLELRGDEQVLDMGCGSGMFLIACAQKLTHGKAVGIDIWSAVDQSDNSIERTDNNVEAEGVAGCVELKTADMRSVPAGDSSYDVVVSSLAIHNISGEKEREKALAEVVRVLKRGGRFVIVDIFYGEQYQDFFSQHGMISVAEPKNYYSYCPPLMIIRGVKR